MKTADEWYSVKDLQRILGLSASGANELMHQLPHITAGKRYGYRVRRAVFDAWTAKQDGYVAPPLQLLKGSGREPA